MEREYVTTVQLAKEFGLSVATIKSWRQKGIGPRYFRASSSPQARVLYPRSGIDAWVGDRLQAEAEPRGGA